MPMSLRSGGSTAQDGASDAGSSRTATEDMLSQITQENREFLKENRELRMKLDEVLRRLQVSEMVAPVPATAVPTPAVTVATAVPVNTTPVPAAVGTSMPSASPVPVTPAYPCIGSAQPSQYTVDWLNHQSNVSPPMLEDRRLELLLARQGCSKELPTFDGNPLDWETFRGQYEESTRIFGMTPCENRLRLQRALKGPALEAVAALLRHTASDSTMQVMELLADTFGEPEKVANALMSKLKKFPPMEKKATDTFRKFSALLQNMVVTLSDVSPGLLDNADLLAEAVDKLPEWQLAQWWMEVRDYRKTSTRFNFKHFVAFYKSVCDGLTTGGIRQKKIHQVFAIEAEEFPSTKCHTVKSETGGLHSAGLPARVQQSVGLNSRACIKCGDVHKLALCKTYQDLPIREKWTLVKANKLCFLCLGAGHASHKCKLKLKCGVENCVRRHHSSLHTTTEPVLVAHMNSGGPVLLKVLPVVISGPAGQVRTHALLDEGSTVTLIDANIAEKVGARGRVSGLNIQGIQEMRSVDHSSRLVKISVAGEDGLMYPIAAHTVSDMKLPAQQMARSRDDACFPETRVLVSPKLLIGQDNGHLAVSREIQEDAGHAFILSRTALGWTAHGASQPPVNVFTLQTFRDDSLHKLVRHHFAVESLGITATLRVPVDITQAEGIMKATTRQLPSGQWETGLLWKDPNCTLPDNRAGAMGRLTSLEKKLSKDRKLASAYTAKMEDLLSKGYAEEVREIHPHPRQWYLPHFAVINPNKPSKLRIVFDAACPFKGVSLNERLLTGPDMLSSLLGNIMQFREGQVAVAADIKEMFLRIKIKPEDQESQRFLWRSKPCDEVKTYRMTSMLFGAKCSPASAQYVRNAVASEYINTHPVAAAAIKDKFYMDDYLNAVDSREEAARTAQQVQQILAAGGFQLTNWASNVPSVIKEVRGVEGEGRAVVKIGAGEEERILGVHWDPEKDTFVYALQTTAELGDPWPTKRALLSTAMKIFDPLGFIACVTIRTKALLQDVWRSNIAWDEKLTQEHAFRWKTWLELAAGVRCEIPRKCRSSRNSVAEVHLFGDASETACCVVAYLREEGQDGRINLTFLGSKCKVAPLKPLSIPRLELQAALMAARFNAEIRKNMKSNLGLTTFWTDSTTVLSWIQSDPRSYSTFVANRLGEIDELTQAKDWRWVPTKQNPADVGTRDVELPDLSPEGLWFGGPAFLRRPPAEWPTCKAPIPKMGPEAKTVVALREDHDSTLPDISRFSSWERLIRTTAWVRRFIEVCCKRAKGQAKLTVAELRRAEELWLQRSQKIAFSAEIDELRHNRSLKNKNGRLAAWSPTLLSNGTLVSDTRLTNLSEVPGYHVRPPILDSRGQYGELIINHIHASTGHQGVEKTIAEVRRDFAAIGLRSAVRSIIHRCQPCRLASSKAKPPMMGSLPEGRLAHHQRAFTHCGVDFFGPMEVVIGRRREKRYGALFTCLTTRAVHLELAHQLSSDSFILALRRMSARRGYPSIMYSDNGTNFHGANKEMGEAVKKMKSDPEFQEKLSTWRIEWRFLPPASPYMGGAWERLVRSVKRALGSTLKNRALKEETLLTALAEAEHVVNSRPLTHVGVDPDDEEPLTPNHFLIGQPSGRPLLANFPKEMEEVCVRKQWRLAQQLGDLFWRRWVKEYLPTLANRQKWRKKAEPLKIDDLVVITDPALPRNSWPRGRVIGVNTGADGQVRSVNIKTSTGEYHRPATKIAKLFVEPSVRALQ